jgi:hypothetical protein
MCNIVKISSERVALARSEMKEERLGPIFLRGVKFWGALGS